MSDCRKDFLNKTIDEKKQILNDRFNSFWENKHKDNDISAHKAKIQDIRHRKNKDKTFSIEDKNASKYLCSKKGVQTFDVKDIDHFKSNQKVLVETPFKGKNPRRKIVTIPDSPKHTKGNQKGETIKETAKRLYEKRFGEKGKDGGTDNKKSLVNYRWEINKKRRVNWKKSSWDEINSKFSKEEIENIKDSIENLKWQRGELNASYTRIRETFGILRNEIEQIERIFNENMPESDAILPLYTDSDTDTDDESDTDITKEKIGEIEEVEAEQINGEVEADKNYEFEPATKVEEKREVWEEEDEEKKGAVLGDEEGKVVLGDDKDENKEEEEEEEEEEVLNEEEEEVDVLDEHKEEEEEDLNEEEEEEEEDEVQEEDEVLDEEEEVLDEEDEVLDEEEEVLDDEDDDNGVLDDDDVDGVGVEAMFQ